MSVCVECIQNRKRGVYTKRQLLYSKVEMVHFVCVCAGVRACNVCLTHGVYCDALLGGETHGWLES